MPVYCRGLLYSGTWRLILHWIAVASTGRRTDNLPPVYYSVNMYCGVSGRRSRKDGMVLIQMVLRPGPALDMTRFGVPGYNHL